jgi:hypothetical protein
MSRRRILLAMTAVLGLALNGCWFQPGWDAHRAGNNPLENTLTASNVTGLTEVWSVPLGGGAISDPAISVEGVHVTAGYFRLTTRRLGDGIERWSASLPGGANSFSHLPGPVSVQGDKVLVPISNYRDFEPGSGVHSYAARTGAGGEVVAPKADGSVTVAGPTVTSTWGEYYGSCIECIATVLDVTNLSDPTQSWSTILTIGLPARPQTTTAVGGGRIFLGDGSQVDAFTVLKPSCSSATPVVCTPVWTRPLGGPPTVPVLSEDARTVYVGDSAGGVRALDAGNGSVLWTANLGGERAITATPTLGGGQLYVTASDGTLHVFDATGCGAPTCTASWAASTASPITKQAALAGGVLYIGSDNGTISAYRADGCGAVLCAPVWKTSTGSRITGAPAVGLGYLVVGTGDGRLLAYHTP